MNTIKELFGPLRALAHIRPPKRSYADWHRFLEQCREAGVAAILRDPKGTEADFRGFATPLGFALLRRWRWLRDSEARGLAYDNAEIEFQTSFERDRKALIEAGQQAQTTAHRAIRERDGGKYGL